MADLLIRGVPEDVHGKIKARAAAAGRSVNDLLLSELVEWAGKPTLAEWLVEVDGGRREGGPTAAEIADVVRSGRAVR